MFTVLNEKFPVPKEVVTYVRKVFRACDKALSLRIERVPNAHETSLDMLLIDELASYASPAVVGKGWTVRIDTHFLGGRRHFYSWEVADIGLLVYVRLGGNLYATKVALLQSKRLSPSAGGVVEDDTKEDYQIGFARLIPSKGPVASLARPTTFKFDRASKYSALLAGDDQAKAIAEFEQHRKIPIHYLLYNPWSVPSQMSMPLTSAPKLSGSGNAGTRVLPAVEIQQVLAGKSKTYRPSFKDIEGLVGVGKHLAGWPIDYFVADLVMGCKQGTLIDVEQNSIMEALFTRRSGPISAAIAISIEKAS